MADFKQRKTGAVRCCGRGVVEHVRCLQSSSTLLCFGHIFSPTVFLTPVMRAHDVACFSRCAGGMTSACGSARSMTRSDSSSRRTAATVIRATRRSTTSQCGACTVRSNAFSCSVSAADTLKEAHYLHPRQFSSRYPVIES